MSKTVRITNLTSRPLSINGGPEIPPIKVAAASHLDVELDDFQFDELFVENLVSFKNRSRISVALEGVDLTATQIDQLKERFVEVMQDDKDVDGVADRSWAKVPAATINLKAVAETSQTLGGLSTQVFIPRRAVVKAGTIVAPLNGNAVITIGTSAGGTQILSAATLTGLTTTGDLFPIIMAGRFAKIAGNATIYFKVTSADTGAGTGTATVTLEGQLV